MPIQFYRSEVRGQRSCGLHQCETNSDQRPQILKSCNQRVSRTHQGTLVQSGTNLRLDQRSTWLKFGGQRSLRGGRSCSPPSQTGPCQSLFMLIWIYLSSDSELFASCPKIATNPEDQLFLSTSSRTSSVVLMFVFRFVLLHFPPQTSSVIWT